MNLVRKHITDLSHIQTRISKKVYGIGNAASLHKRSVNGEWTN
jgi:hypothetical protein